MNQFDIYLTSLDPTQGSEIKKTRPCVIISPDEMNTLSTLIVAPMTTKGFPFITRVPIIFQGKKGKIVLDQILSLDKNRLVRKVGKLRPSISKKVLGILQEMFS